MGYRKLGEPFSPVGLVLGKASKSGFQWNQFATFEAGVLIPYPTGFDTITGVAGNLAVNAAAAMHGNFGFAVTLAGAGSEARGEFLEPVSITKATIEFLFDPNGLAMAPGDNFAMFDGRSGGPGGLSFFVRLNRGAPYTTNIFYADDAGVQTPTIAINLQDRAVAFRFEFKASDAPGRNNGFVKWWQDGAVVLEATGIDNDQHDITRFRFGGLFGIDAGTNGIIFFDNVRWADRLM